MNKADTIHFRIIEFASEHYHNALQIRDEVLRKPLGLIFDPKDLEQEKSFIHVAGFVNNVLSATAILVPEGSVMKMKQVAVRKEMQGKGVGNKLLKFCEKYALEHGYKEIYAHARVSVTSFYLNHSYVTEGEIFEEVTIPHIKVRKSLLL